MRLPATDTRTSEPAARIGALFDRLGTLRGEMIGAETDDAIEQVLEEVEATTVEIAETSVPQVESCRQKAALLRERLLDMLDCGVASEAVTLALAASLVLDLARLDG
jgi:hypothetical protein